MGFGEAKSWEDTEAWIGKELIDKPIEGADEVDRGSIRRRCEVLETDCPIYCDEKAAKEAGYETVVAPETMVWTYCQPAYWKPGDAETKLDAPPKMPPMVMMKVPMMGTAGFATDVEIEFLNSMYPGDRVILNSAKLISLTRKQTRVGDGAFMMFEQIFVNQKGQKIAVAKMGLFNYVPGA